MLFLAHIDLTPQYVKLQNFFRELLQQVTNESVPYKSLEPKDPPSTYQHLTDTFQEVIFRREEKMEEVVDEYVKYTLDQGDKLITNVNLKDSVKLMLYSQISRMGLRLITNINAKERFNEKVKEQLDHFSTVDQSKYNTILSFYIPSLAEKVEKVENVPITPDRTQSQLSLIHI